MLLGNVIRSIVQQPELGREGSGVLCGLGEGGICTLVTEVVFLRFANIITPEARYFTFSFYFIIPLLQVPRIGIALSGIFPGGFTHQFGKITCHRGGLSLYHVPNYL